MSACKKDPHLYDFRPRFIYDDAEAIKEICQRSGTPPAIWIRAVIRELLLSGKYDHILKSTVAHSEKD